MPTSRGLEGRPGGEPVVGIGAGHRIDVPGAIGPQYLAAGSRRQADAPRSPRR